MNAATLFPIFVTLASHVSFAVQQLESTHSFSKDTTVKSPASSYVEPSSGLGAQDSPVHIQHPVIPGKHSDDSHEQYNSPVTPSLNLSIESTIKPSSAGTSSEIKYSKRKRRWSNFTSWGKRDTPTRDNDQGMLKRWGDTALWRKRKWSNFSAWGKRDPDTAATNNDQELLKRWGDNALWGKRKWSNFSAWGKRDPNTAVGDNDQELLKRWGDTALWGKRKWSNFSAWGKRHHDTAARDNDQDMLKRWGDTALWGKRKWSNFTAWGKRDHGTAVGDNDQELLKRWSDTALWGKRGNDKTMKDYLPVKVGSTGYNWLADTVGKDKKWKQMTAWGKRLSDQQRVQIPKMNQIRNNDFENPIKDMFLTRAGFPSPREQQKHVYKLPEQTVPDERIVNQLEHYLSGEQGAGMPSNKRWNQMSVWGKRHTGDIGDEQINKKWKQQSLWGKRDSDKQLGKKWRQMSLWGKRGSTIDDDNQHEMLNKRWKDMAPWGKRDDSIPDKKWGEVGVWGKRSNTDTSDAHEQTNSDGDVNINKRWKEMALWGKRDPEDADAFQHFDKKWVDRSKADKRTFTTNIRNWRDIKMWGRKRPSWSRTGFTSWGKRSAGDDEGLVQHNLYDSQPTSIGDSGQSRGEETALSKETQP